ncbi:hypothetical protein EB233_10415 [Mesorhizobium erdmanii]|uniref:Bacterial OB-fold domain-containing protein n=2 Tax=Mesorhizobium erdmanii TaxID=1777866 RepID=A0A6M7UIC3_9HYPH|nr:hypothetical protein [Mesorhizobium loti]OBQ73709.1 hypothetical protein A8146_24200 [Mesorhizobium loti]QKC75898.1 hypothetical protein EB233_10415 [Mesorhizobium erdmanii]
MSNQDNIGPSSPAETSGTATDKSSKRRLGAKMVGGSALVGMLLVGAVAGAVAMKVSRHDERQALLPPVTINAMADDSLVAVKGKVAEIFGNKFVISDGTGRTLVDVGPEGSNAKLVAQDEEVTVQGRYDEGFIHAGMVIHGDGRVDELRPPHPRGPRHGWRDFGPDAHGRGPGDDAPPPPKA